MPAHLRQYKKTLDNAEALPVFYSLMLDILARSRRRVHF